MAATESVVQVLPYANLWKIKLTGDRDYHSVYQWKREAIDNAVELAKRQPPTKLIVHGDDGSIEYEIEYEAETDSPGA
jgi:hypothetical protein